MPASTPLPRAAAPIIPAMEESSASTHLREGERIRELEKTTFLSPLLPRTVHEGQRGGVAARQSEEPRPEPEDSVPVEENRPESLHTRRAVVAEQEERDEESPEQHRDDQPLGCWLTIELEITSQARPDLTISLASDHHRKTYQYMYLLMISLW